MELVAVTYMHNHKIKLLQIIQFGNRNSFVKLCNFINTHIISDVCFAKHESIIASTCVICLQALAEHMYVYKNSFDNFKILYARYDKKQNFTRLLVV